MPGQRNKDQEAGQRMAAADLGMRFEERYEISIEIEVSGIDPNGKAFHNRTYTKNISSWGCAFLLPVELRVDDIVSVRMVSDNPEKAPLRQSLFQVIRVTRELEGWLLGTWKMDSEDLWDAELEKLGDCETGRPISQEECVKRRAERRGKNRE